MADYRNPIQDRDPLHDPLIVPPIEKNKQFKEKFADYSLPKEKVLLFSTLLSCFKKIFTLFAPKAKTIAPMIDKEQILADLLAMRKMFQQLANGDESHDPDYTQQLGELWHNLLDDFNYVAQFTHETPEELGKIKIFIENVSNYPPKADHSLGFYFAEYAGKDWLPFPFMALLQQLHDDYLENPQASQLRQWIAQLNDAISSWED